MNTHPRTSEWLYVGLAALPLLYLAAIWTQLPDTIPTHFDITTGKPDGFGPKTSFAIGFALMSAFLYGLLRAIPSLDPTKRLQASGYDRIRLTIMLFTTGLFTLGMYTIHAGESAGITSDLITSGVYLLFSAIGNIMLNVPQNYFVGIKTPWALANETNWRKTHRLAGKLWFAGGLLGFSLNLILPDELTTGLMLTIVGVLTLVPYIYSYQLFKQGLAVALLLCSGTLASAQTVEAVRYAITQPVGASVTLEGTLSLPGTVSGPSAPHPVPVVLLIAGSGTTDRDGNAPGLSINMYRQLADSLTKRGVAVLRYDKRFSGTNMATAAGQLLKQPLLFDYMVDDAVGFIRQLQADKRFSKIIVAGHSEGSLVGMLAATQTNANGFISIAGAGRNIADVLKTQLAEGGIQGEGLALAHRDLDSLRAGMRVQHPFMLLASLFSPVNQPYLISWMRYDPARSLQAYKGPVLLLQGKRDVQVSVGDVERLKAARPDAQLILFDTMTHVLKEGPAERAANIASYTAPGSTILPTVADAIATFAR